MNSSPGCALTGYIQAGPLAKIEGINHIAQQSTGMSLPKSPVPLFPVLTPQDREKYTNIFRRAGPVNGLLSGTESCQLLLARTDELLHRRESERYLPQVKTSK